MAVWGREATDTSICLDRRGGGHGNPGKVVRVIGGDPQRAQVAASTSSSRLQGGVISRLLANPYMNRSSVALRSIVICAGGAAWSVKKQFDEQPLDRLVIAYLFVAGSAPTGSTPVD
jgi:hypothetical protein